MKFLKKSIAHYCRPSIGIAAMHFLCHRHGTTSDCGSCYSRRTAMINLLMRQIALRRWCSRRIPAFDRLGGGSRRCFCHGYYVSFAVTLLLQKLQKASDFCNNFCNLRLQNGPDTPVLSNISQDFRWYVVMVFSSYEFLCSFCNNGCKTDVT